MMVLHLKRPTLAPSPCRPSLVLAASSPCQQRYSQAFRQFPLPQDRASSPEAAHIILHAWLLPLNDGVLLAAAA